MATVFLSYDHDDVDRAAPIASALEKAGHSVWWDRHIHGGAAYNDEIEAAVESASAVIVLWSERSVRSTWVRDEAAEGRDQNKLVPVLLDAVKPPMGFRQFQTIDLSRWKGRGKPDGLPEILACIGRLDDLPERPATEAPRSASRRLELPNALRLSLITALVFAGIAAAYILMGRGGKASIPVVAVAAADNSSASRSLADDLFIKLGSLQSSNAQALQLVGKEADRDADLSFRVSQRVVDGQANATVALLAGGNGGLLWSREFRQQQRPESDLRQQIAYSVALVLTCATEAMAPGHEKLEDVTLKLYLSGCSRFTGETDEEPQIFIDLFGKVTQQAPNFEGGWAKLLIAETDAYLRARRDPTIGKSLKMHVRQARRVNPTMAEAYNAEAWMSEIRDINGWLPLMAEAVRKNPSNVVILTEHANDMYQVGRLQQAIIYARRAVQADPLSPWVRNALITALAQAGEVEAAKDALEEAERLWPGATNLLYARFFLTSRYGDAREALAILRSGNVSRQFMSPALASFLEARADPSPAKVDRAVQDARDVSDRWFGTYIETLGQFRRKEELIKALMEHDPGAYLGPAKVFEPSYSFLQEDVRFMVIMKRWGSQLDYWRKSGNWPDFCLRPGLPYDCKAEAAKLAA